jgi:hypothetical protein
MKVNQYSIHVLAILLLLADLCQGQQNVGINTTTPVRNLEVYGSANQHVRIQKTLAFGGQAILELVQGGDLSEARDYKLTNETGDFKIMTGIDNFDTPGEELWHMAPNGDVGIGTTLPTSRLHIDNGLEASNTGDGYLLLGTKTGTNLVLDPNEIISRNNSNANSITLQSHDGDTYIGNGGGHTYIGDASGNLGIGTSSTSSRLTIEDDDFQLTLKNTGDGVNDWYIGASNTTWTTSDNQLLFSPNQTSDAAVLRLLDVTNNGGVVAPVMIRSSATQTLLMDGNEIDTKVEPLYINHNSDQNTYFNASGGRVGIGSDDPSCTLLVNTQEDEYALRIQSGATAWDINPLPAFDYLGFVKEAWTLAYVNGASGNWTTISDRRLKEHILELPQVMDKLNRMNVYTYSFKQDARHKPHIGVIAQEIEKEFPELVNINDGNYTVAYSKLSVIIIKALQEQEKQIDALEQEINLLLAAQSK